MSIFDSSDNAPLPFMRQVVEGLPDTPANLAWLQAHFECEQCGECCRIHTVGVRITRQEAERLAQREGLTLPQQLAGILEDRDTFLIPQPCPYLADNRCSIHDIKPSVCRRYPFNQHETVRQNTAWVIIAGCPGGQKLARLLAGGRQLGLEYRPFKTKK